MQNNPNMALRGYLYMAAAFQKYIAWNKLDIFSSRRISIPVPRYYVFYNGMEKMPDEWDMRLTDSMPDEDASEKSSAQFIAHMVNINAGHSPKIMERCPMLYEYSLLIAEIRKNHEAHMPLQDAVETAVDYCIRNNILGDILRGNKAEVTSMLLKEYDEAFHIANEKEISLEEGRELERENTERERKRADAAELKSSVMRLKLKNYNNKEIAKELKLEPEAVERILEDALK